MGSVNKAILVGNLGRDAEMRFTAGGTAVATVSIATTERFTDKDGHKHNYDRSRSNAQDAVNQALKALAAAKDKEQRLEPRDRLANAALAAARKVDERAKNLLSLSRGHLGGLDRLHDLG